MGEIAACVGRKEAEPELRALLRRLERGDGARAGFALLSEGAAVRSSGEGEPLSGRLGVGGTAQPPGFCCDRQLAVAHGGEVENLETLREWLAAKGHQVRSDSGSEILAHLLEDVWVPPLQLAVARLLPLLEGRFVLVVFCVREPGRLVAAHRSSPLLVGIGEGESYVASDAAALVPLTRRVVRLEDDELAVVDADGCDILDARRMTRASREISLLPLDRVDRADPAEEDRGRADGGVSRTPGSSPAPTG